MKKNVILFLSIFFTLKISSQSINTEFPDELYVIEKWLSLTKTYDVKTNNQKLGTVYKRFISMTLSYDFYDINHEHTLTAKSRLFSLGLTLDLYDSKGNHLGTVNEKIFEFFPKFDIIGRNQSTKLATAEMNFWGTKFYVYDPINHQEIAVMSRPFFRLKNNWEIHITNKKLLQEKKIDFRSFMTVLAVQGEIEDWKIQETFKKAKHFAQTPKIKIVNDLINLTRSHNSFTSHFKESDLEDIASEIDNNFILNNPNFTALSTQEKIQKFSDICHQYIKDKNISKENKDLLIQLLKIRLTN